jgi:pyruvate dehydrogenase E2 component (dihydrolipoyllysine-residue acetyltransferase)
VTVTMPRLSDSMEEGTIVRWLKRSGETVAPGDVLAEIETDKATMEYEAESAGMLEIVAAEGATVAVGELIARLGAARVRATPVARRLARELGADLSAITPSGRRGQVMKHDVLAAVNGATREAAPPPEVAPPAPGATPAPDATPAPPAPDVTPAPLTATQRTIASRMAKSRASVPDFDVEVEIDMTATLALRAEVDAPPSINDFIVKACALALRDHPRVNGTFSDGFASHDHVNVGIAVATDDALLVPVITDADTRSLRSIAETSRELASRVRERRIEPQDLQGATFTVSNLGMFGVTRFTAVIDEPQAAILAVGAVQDRVIAKDGRPAIAPILTATLAADHRIVYGADAARFLAHVKDLLQTPMRMLL